MIGGNMKHRELWQAKNSFRETYHQYTNKQWVVYNMSENRQYRE